MSNSVSTNYYFYNKLGYAQCNRQKTGGRSYDFRYTTTPEGEWKQMVYPSGRTVNVAYGDRGLPTSVGSYASGVMYWSHGGMRQLTFGNALVENATYNSRSQMDMLELGAAATPGSIWKLANVYGSTATKVTCWSRM